MIARALCSLFMMPFLFAVASRAKAQCDQPTWRWSLNGAGSSAGHKVLVHANGDTYIGGYSNGYGTDYDFLLARFTPTGQLVWSKRYDVFNDDGGQSMCLATGPSGAIYIGGTLAGVVTNQEDGSLLKLDPDGNVLWANRLLPMPFYCQVRAMAERSDGDLIVVGSANSIGAGNADSYAARFSANGTLQWLTSYGWTGQDHFTDIELLADGSFTACSQSMGSPVTNRKAYIAHIADDGSPIGCRLHNGGVLDNYNHGVRNQDGTFLWVGYTESYGSGLRDVLAVLTDSIGNRIWSRVYGTGANEEGLNAVPEPGGGWRISAFQGPNRLARVLNVMADGSLSGVRGIQDISVPASASWAHIMERSSDGGLLFLGGNATTGGDIVLAKLDACADTPCGTEELMWQQAAPVIPQLTPTLPISASSTNVTAINVTSADITPQFVQAGETIDCDTCEVNLVQPDMLACAGAQVVLQPQFFGSDPAAFAWSWSLGDGTQSMAVSSVEHTYAAAGLYIAEVLLHDTAGACADTLVFQVQVDEVSLPDLGPDIIVCPEEQVVLLVTPCLGCTVAWSDGSSADSLVVAQSGTFWVEFQQGACTALDSVVIDQVVLPDLLIAADTTICTDDEFIASAESGWTNYLWSDGSLTESIVIADGGTYWVQGNWNGCFVADTLVVAEIVPPVLDLGPDLQTCVGDVVLLSTGQPGWVHAWSTGETTESIEVVGSGAYWVQVGPLGCSAADTVLVEFNQPPSVDLGPDQLLCDGVSITLGPVIAEVVEWSFGGAGSMITVVSAGTYSVSASEFGCVAADTVVITTGISPIVVLPADTSACGVTGINVVPEVAAGGALLWSTGSQAQSIQANSSGTYWLSISNACGTAWDTMLVQLFDALELDLGPDGLLCGDAELPLVSPYPASASLWNDTLVAQSVVVGQPGTYWLSVTLNGCTVSDTIVVSASPLPSIVLPPDTVLCELGPVVLEVVSVVAEEVLWSTGETGVAIVAAQPGVFVAMASNSCGSVSDSVIVSIAPVPLVDDERVVCWGELARVQLPVGFTSVAWSNGSVGVDASLPVGDHQWVAVDDHGCPRKGAISVYVDTLADGLVFVPNVFTPNGDGVNDQFRAVASDQGEFSLTVFNRWGQEVWSTSDPRDSWDGTHGGITVPDGTYVYLLMHRVFCSEDESRRERIGHVTVLR